MQLNAEHAALNDASFCDHFGVKCIDWHFEGDSHHTVIIIIIGPFCPTFAGTDLT